mmetsp:Transcript_25536/g.33378  ORF Transcript_25536/g.33378 Transcript_25536/m.33378 type:complete len:604 (-) Transcript_25536:211-2022(-)
MEESKGQEDWSKKLGYSTFSDDLIPQHHHHQEGGSEKLPLYRRHSKLSTLAYMTVALIICMALFESRSHYARKAEENSEYDILEAEQFSLSNKDKESLSTLSTKSKTGSPHIIFILADDLGFGDATVDSPDLKDLTPNIQKLTSQSMKLTSYYTQYMCTPTRAALLTGVYPYKSGMQHSSISTKAPWGLPLEMKLLPEYLKEAGYNTHMVGKWHLGFYKTDYLPANRGFDSFLGILSEQTDYYTHESEICLDMDVCFADFSEQREADGELIPLIEAVDEGLYAEDVYRQRVDDILAAADPDEPFFLYMAHQLVHLPLESPPEGEFTETQRELIESIEEETRKTYAKMNVYLDNSIGRLVDGLKANGMYDNSIIILTSDNGGCPSNGASNGDLRGHKSTLYEGGVRVHAMVHSPLFDTELHGKHYDGLFHVTDWMPTLLEGVLGIDVGQQQEELDGVNQWSSLLGKTTSAARKEIFLNIDSYDYVSVAGGIVKANYPKSAMIKHNLKLIVNENLNVGWHDPYDFTTGETCTILAAYEPSFQLFDLEKDPYETENLVKENPMAVLHMLEEISTQKEYEKFPAYTDEALYGLESWKAHDYFVCPWE